MVEKLQRLVYEHFDDFVAVRAERKFKEVAKDLAMLLTPDVLEKMAQGDIPLADVMPVIAKVYPRLSPANVKPDAVSNPGVRYLLNLTDARILALLDQVMPEQVRVLYRHPGYASKVILSLKRMVSGDVMY